jgi:hypothetical protein
MAVVSFEVDRILARAERRRGRGARIAVFGRERCDASNPADFLLVSPFDKQ